jgi:BirA family biotin operon repressor/biotin-[acetyl-CoA-carboxylase] ligase
MKPASQILRLLRLSPSQPWHIDTLADKLALPQETIHKEIKALQAGGFPIVEEPFYGYRLLHSPDILIAENIESYLPEKMPFPWRCLVYRETASTNDLATQLIEQGEKEGLALFAESQTQGRGRLQRIWESRSGVGLWFSLLLRPYWSVAWTNRLTVIAAAAVIKGIEKFIPEKLQIKWPNDILLREKKLGGILTETKINGNQIYSAVIGIGLNINHASEDFSEIIKPIATSLAQTTGGLFVRAEIAATILTQFSRLYVSNFEESQTLWQERCLTLKRDIVVQTPTGKIEGRAETIAEDGCLMIRDGNGYLQWVNSGEIISS